ncbi:uncharacterized protein PGTG_18945 [Puccinia graminis f. sp. tritici CRL 75-36-700-3]|uniref:Uncharacterized protein n=1 Tax=Puccinia graminis f. sp. tritici (strain CRL 75-36-700-3 / race SCCL) TaxID=418459 RepID=E3LAF6_PUCGT|nr:uncharacterized protein PGTG_18945 [Puccinia graminis f. sp. tritici CRL 75-36-700-3]EFP93531.1 hypothetical protein PGTG_18945 [Puccinia graminis f. sp. tritici CRL 75-36-700-3]
MATNQLTQTSHTGGDSTSTMEKTKLKEVQEQLTQLATRLDDLSAKHPPTLTLSVDRITCFDQFYPNLKPITKKMLEDLSFEDRMIMCSSTIERNEFYQEAAQSLRLYESLVAKAILQHQRPDNYLDIDQYIATILKKIDCDHQYKKLRSELLRLRLRRYRIESIIHRMETSVVVIAKPPTSL